MSDKFLIQDSKSMLKHMVLTESIDHLEDLSPTAFIQTVKTIKDRVVTEKLDGANLWFGIDEAGFYTSREAKTPKRGRFYTIKDYGAPTPNNVAFRAAHLALEKVQDTIKKYLDDGDAVEIEVLFGRQPNTVTYGLSDSHYIVILRGVSETPSERVDALSRALEGEEVEVRSAVVSSEDGKQLKTSEEDMKWKFSHVKPIKSQKIDTSGVDEILAQMEKFLAADNSVVGGATNQEVLELSLNTVKKENREAVKAERTRLEDLLMSKFKQPIKEILLSKFVRKIKPFLQSPNLHPSEKDIGVEGVVMRDEETNNQVKIVDKQVFSEINQFNSSVRNEISGMVITLDPNQPLKNRGGLFGQAKIHIAQELGVPDMARSSGAPAIIKKLGAQSADDAAEKLGAQFKIDSMQSTKSEIVRSLLSAKDAISKKLELFKNTPVISGTLSSGKKIEMTPETRAKTLTSFAAVNTEIRDMIAAVKASKTPADLARALFGRNIDSAFKGAQEVKESYTLIRAIAEDGEGGAGGEAGGEAPAAAPATTAGAIAPFATKIFGNKQVVKRLRSYSPQGKFSRARKTLSSLLRRVNEDASATDTLSNATDVDDNIRARNDVEFKRLRNSVGFSDTVTQVDVSNYLKKAHEINDEVDTVIFGMEMSDGSVVKVYVAADQSDKFEAALSDMLGKEDDIEKVIDELSSSFDIVDVVWPEVAQDEPAEPDIIDAQKEKEEQKEQEREEEKQKQADSQSADDTPKEPTEKETESSPEDDEEIHLGVESDDEAEDEEKPKDGDKENEEEPEEESEEESGKPTTKKQTKEHNVKTIGQLFKQRLLGEADEASVEDTKDHATVAAAREKYKSIQLLSKFTRASDRAIITLMLDLGAPVQTLTTATSELRDRISEASTLYRSNPVFKKWALQILAFIQEWKQEEGKNIVEAEEPSALDKKLNSKYQHVVYHVLGALGMPEYVEEVRPFALTAGIRASARIAAENANFRKALNGLADILGVSDKVRHMAEPVGSEVAAPRNMNEERVDEAKGDLSFEDHVKKFTALQAQVRTALRNMQKAYEAYEAAQNVYAAAKRVGDDYYYKHIATDKQLGEAKMSRSDSKDETTVFRNNIKELIDLVGFEEETHVLKAQYGKAPFKNSTRRMARDSMTGTLLARLVDRIKKVGGVNEATDVEGAELLGEEEQADILKQDILDLLQGLGIKTDSPVSIETQLERPLPKQRLANKLAASGSLVKAFDKISGIMKKKLGVKQDDQTNQ